MRDIAAISIAAPIAIARRAGAASWPRATRVAAAPALARALPANANGSSRRPSYQTGTDVSDTSTAVYVQSAGPSAADVAEAASCTRGSTPKISQTTTAVSAAPLTLRIHVPRFIGDVGLKTRSMFMNRSGRPRSLIRSTGLTATPAKAVSDAARAIRRLPARRAANASMDDAPAMPPVKKYQAISCFQMGGLMTGRP